MHVKRVKAFIDTHKTDPLAIFLLKGFLFFLLWDVIVYPYVITPGIHDWVIYRLLDLSRIALGWFYSDIFSMDTELYINGFHCVHIGLPCDGIEVMGVFASIVVAYRAKWFHKTWMVFCGIILIFLLNAARISVLASFVYNHRIRAFDINHKYIFNVVLYGVLLLVFSVWSSKFGKTKSGSIG